MLPKRDYGVFNFCNDPVVECEDNILSKVENFELQLKKWVCRNPTMVEKNIDN
jgi:hypothetical protein